MSLSAFNEPRWQLRLLIAIIGFSLFLLLPGIAKYHGDECFYTDAAIRMTETGDYLTPYAANGALRFAKPILPYWAVLAGYSVFGINFLGSRFIFMLAGCLAILLTYRLSLSLFQRPERALVAALIVASNVQLLTISIRSTPDALLCLSCLLSLLGFARLIFQKSAAWRDYGLAWGGAALAVQTRGLPGVAVALFPFVYCLVFRRGRTRLRALFEWKAAVLALLVAVSWFAAMIWLHGQALVDGFYYDQVTENLQDSNLMAPLKNVVAYAVGVSRHFLPWSLLLVIGLVIDRRVAVAAWREQRDKCWFLLGWYLFILAPFLFGDSHRTRYMVIAYPLLAVLLAELLARYAAAERFSRWHGRFLGLGALLFGAGGIVLGVAGAVIGARAVAASLLFLAAAVGIGFVVRRRPREYAVATAALSVVAFWGVELCLRPAFAHSPAPALVARLLPEGVIRQRVYAVNFSPSFQAQMRVLSRGKLKVVPLSLDELAAMDGAEHPVVFDEHTDALPPTQTGVVEQVGFASRKWRGRDFLDLFNKDKREGAYARNKAPCYVLFPAASSQSNGERAGSEPSHGSTERID